MKIDPTKYAVEGKAAALCGVKQQTLWSAVTRGDVPHVALADGTRLVALADVRRWWGKPQSGRGRPRAVSAVSTE